MAPKDAAAAKGKAKADGKSKAKKEKKVEDEGERVEPPNREELDEAVGKIQEVINGLSEKQAALQAQIKARSGGKEEFFEKKNEIRAQLDALSDKIKDLLDAKSGYQGQVKEKSDERRQMNVELSKMKKSIGYHDVTEIDQRIEQIEVQLRTDTMSLKQEKDLLKEISDLKKNRSKVGHVTTLQEKVSAMDPGKNVQQQIYDLNEEIKIYRDAKTQVQEKMSALMKERQDQMGDISKVIEDRDALQKEIQEQIKLRNEARDAFKEKEKVYQAYQQEQRSKRAAKAAEERKEFQAERAMRDKQKKADALDQQPHIQEMTLIEQTITYCKGLIQTKGEEVKEEKKEIEHKLDAGMMVLTKKQDRDEEFLVTPTKGKKGKSKVKSAKQDGAAKPIKHNAHSFKLFDDLKLDAPITTDCIPGTLEKLNEQLEMYKEKVKEWEINRAEMKRKILEEVDGEDGEAGAEKEQNEE